MNIILAVDIINGKVVKAFAGVRINYKPLFLGNKDYSDPIKLISNIKKKIDLKKVYIADLDSISKLGTNNRLIEKILYNFPDITFLIDAGFDYPLSVYYYHKRKKNQELDNYKIVLGTETLRNFNLKSYTFLKKTEISIDFNGKQNNWIKRIKKEKICLDIILMFLDKVGGRGLDFKLIKKLKGCLTSHNLTVAGGVKTEGQIAQLSRVGVQNVLSSSLLHKMLSRDSFESLDINFL